MKPDTETLFLTVANTLSLTQAARQLGITTAAVSKHIKQLETQLGQPLLVRSSRALRLTEAGKLYGESCEQVCRARQQFQEQLKEIDGDVKGTIRLTVPPVYASHVLPPMLAQFSQAYPQVGFNISTNYQNTDLITGAYDFAIRLGALEDSSMFARQLCEVDLYICASPSYSAALGDVVELSDLLRARYIVVEGFTLKQSLINKYFKALAQTPGKILLSTNDTRLQLEAVVHGLGVSVLPDYLANPLLSDGRLVRLLPAMKIAALPLSVVYPGARQMPLRVRMFMEYLFRQYEPGGQGPIPPGNPVSA